MALNPFAVSLIPSLALAIAGFVRLRSWPGQTLSLAAAAVISAGLYLTMSRGALVGLAVMAVVFLYRFRVRWQVLLVVCLLIGVAATMPQAFFDRIFAVGGKDDTGAGRTWIWAVGIEALAKYALVGGGFRSFMDVFGQFIWLSGGSRGSHNSYLETWVELGVVGLALLLVALACHLWAVRRIQVGRSTNTTMIALPGTEAACYGLIVAAFFGEHLWTKYFWLSWILLSWAVQVAERWAGKPAVTREETPAEGPHPGKTSRDKERPARILAVRERRKASWGSGYSR